MSDNNIDYKKAYEELLEKVKELQKKEKERSIRHLIDNGIPKCFEHEISIVSQEDIVGLQPDHWLLKSKTNYIGFIQVKCNEDSFYDPKVIGQMFDYLMGLSYHFGKLQAFGLLLTYNKAMPLFTHDSLKSATSVLPDQIGKTVKLNLNHF